jgi:photosystem II stability/assembly factor-like uncharacterized protein
MKRQICAMVTAVLISAAMLLVLLRVLAAPLNGAPTVTGINPTSITNDSDNSIAISGADFAAVLSGTEVITPPAVYLDSTSLGGAGWVSTTTLTITVPMAFPVGVYTVTVANPDGQSGSLADSLTVRYPAPVLQGLSPVSSTYGQATVLTMTGTGFVATPTATLGETPCSVGYVSSTTLTTTVPGNLLPGIHSLTVCNPEPGSPCDALPDVFTLYSPIPTVLVVSSDSAPNDLDTQVVITGTGFAPTPTVTLEAIPLQNVTWVSLTRLTALVPWGMDEGTYNLTVTNPSPGAASDMLSDAFTVTQGIGVWNPTALYGGSVEQVVIHPLTPTLLYASTSFGLFRSQDGGENWFTRLDPAQWHLTFDLDDPDVLYAEGRPHDAGQFIWRSDDAGETWIPLTTTFPITETSGRGCWVRHQIQVVSGTLYLGACGEPGGPSGLIASLDRGETWLSASTGLTDTQVTALAFSPVDPQTAYLGTASGNVFISHNGGYSWSFASRPVSYVHHLAVNPFGDHEVWVSAGMRLGDPCGLFRSTDPGLTSWTLIPGEKPGDEWCDANVVFAPEAWGETVSATVFIIHHGAGSKTTEGGDTWHPFGPDGWLHAIALHPTDSNTIYIGEGGGGDAFYKTTDGGANWQVANHGMTAIAPELITSPDRPDVIYGLASTGNVYRGIQGGQIWQHLPISGVVSTLVDPITTTRVYAGVSDGVWISEDEGQTWPIYVPITRPVEYADCGMWIDVLSPAPSQPGALIATAYHFGWSGDCVHERGSLYRSDNFGQDWQRIDLGREISRVNDIVYDPISPTMIYAAIGNQVNNDDRRGGGILKSSDGGVTWSSPGEWPIDDGVPLDLEMEPGTHRIFANVNAGLPLYVSDDGGVTWVPTGVGDWQNVFDWAFVSGNPPVLYIAGLQGLYRSTDGAQSWQRAAGALGQVPVYSIAAAEADGRVILYVSTIGGYVDADRSQALSLMNDNGTLVNPGVYRYTMLPPLRIYLPLVLRMHAP